MAEPAPGQRLTALHIPDRVILDIDALRHLQGDFSRNTIVWDNQYSIVTMRFLNGAAAYAASGPIEPEEMPRHLPEGRAYSWFSLLQWEPSTK